ncbi:MAG: hypothetical protein WDZ31_01865 [Phycisphaeraceae bacterium]
MSNDGVIERAPTRPQTRQAVRGERACPRCDYNLQGLAGPVVACPECGTHWDLHRLASNWRGQSWYGCPGFGVIVMPAFFAGLSVVSLLFVGGGLLAIDTRQFDDLLVQALLLRLDAGTFISIVMLAALLSIAAVGWLWLLVRVGRYFRAAWAVLAALGFHLVGGAYLAALVLVPYGFIAMFAAILNALLWGYGPMPTIAPFAGAVVVVLIVLAAARWIESRIGRRCLREEQWRRARVAGPAARHA